MIEIIYSPQFFREYRRLSVEVKEKAEEKEDVFRKNPFDPRLKTHKLSGRLEGFLSFSIDYHYRIIFKFQDNKKIKFYAIGDHSLYDRL